MEHSMFPKHGTSNISKTWNISFHFMEKTPATFPAGNPRLISVCIRLLNTRLLLRYKLNSLHKKNRQTFDMAQPMSTSPPRGRHCSEAMDYDDELAELHDKRERELLAVRLGHGQDLGHGHGHGLEQPFQGFNIRESDEETDDASEDGDAGAGRQCHPKGAVGGGSGAGAGPAEVVMGEDDDEDGDDDDADAQQGAAGVEFKEE